MGLLDIIGQDRLNELLQTKVKNKMLEAKMEENKLKTLQSLSDAVTEYQTQQAWASKGAMELNEKAGTTVDPFDPSQIQPVQPNSSKLLDSLVAATATSNPGVAATVFQEQQNPKRKMLEAVLPLVIGAGQNGGSQPNGLGELIKQGAMGDTGALATGAALKMGGVDLAPFMEQFQKAQDTFEQTTWNPTERKFYSQRINKLTLKPAGEKVISKPTNVDWKTIDLPGGTKIDVPTVEGKQIPFDYAIPGASSIGNGQGGIMKDRGPGQLPIPETERAKWLNENGENPPVNMTPSEAEKAGFVLAPTLTGAQASWFSAAVNGINNVDAVRKRLFNKKGEVDRKLLFKMNAFIGNPIPGTEGEKYYSLLTSAKEAQIRAESGAAVPDQEITRMAKRYVVNFIANPDTIKTGLDQLQNNLTGFITATDPKGIMKKIIEKKQKKADSDKQEGNIKSLSDEELLKELEK